MLCPSALIGQKSIDYAETMALADEYFSIGDYLSAAEFYEEALSLDSTNSLAQLRFGISLYSLRVYRDRSLKPLQNAFEAGEKDAAFFIGTLLHEQGDLDAEQYLTKAVEAPTKYVSKDVLEKRLIQFENYKEAVKNPATIQIHRLDSHVNSRFIEHTPVVSYDDSLLLFTSRRPANDRAEQDATGLYDENIFSVKLTDSGFAQTLPLGKAINQELNDAVVSMSADKKSMVFFRTSRDLQSGNLWRAQAVENGWGKSYKIEHPINTDYNETGLAVSSDESVWIVASDRPGGYGGMDLYRIVQFGNGDFSEAVNLGESINTEWDEISPFLLPDDRTLYFSSDREQGIGGFDLYVATADSASLWSAPKCLEYPLNTSRDDVHLTIASQSHKAYFARASSDSMGNYDIYTSTLPGFNLQANIIRGRVVDAQSEAVLAEVLLSEGEDSYSPNAFFNREDGSFFIVILPGEEVKYHFEREGYQQHSVQWQFQNVAGIHEIATEVKLYPEEG